VEHFLEHEILGLGEAEQKPLLQRASETSAFRSRHSARASATASSTVSVAPCFHASGDGLVVERRVNRRKRRLVLGSVQKLSSRFLPRARARARRLIPVRDLDRYLAETAIPVSPVTRTGSAKKIPGNDQVRATRGPVGTEGRN
jgi:hypothetical protein